MRVLDLFSGIGGFSLGLERAGMQTVAFCEIDPFCQQVLRKHWPGVPIYEDIRTFEGIATDLISGGFPCQDISWAGPGGGIAGERSGLWTDLFKTIRLVRPRVALVENVPALLSRGMGVVLRDLSRIGYDAEWSIISACSVGAAHVRRRLFIVAYPNGQYGREGFWNSLAQSDWAVQTNNRLQSSRISWSTRLENPSALYGGADGIPNGPHRNRAIGNAVVPQITELLGGAIMEIEHANTTP